MKKTQIWLAGLFVAMALFAGCGEAEETLRCGEGTVEVDGACTLVDGLSCGSGTVEEGGVCVPSDGLRCGEGTREVNGDCLPDDEGLVCGSGTVEEGGVCVPSDGLSCGAGTVENNGVCEAQGPGGSNPPEVNLVSEPGNFLIDQTRAVTFSVDVAHSWQLEVGGYFLGAGELLESGDGAANTLVSIDVEGEELGIGAHQLRLYVFVEEEGVRAISVVEMSVFVRGALAVLVWGRGANSTEMVRDVIAADPRVASTEIRSDTVTNPSPPSLDYLLNFDVVVFGWSGTTAEGTGNRIAQYVEAGGAMVVWPFADNGWPLGGWTAGNYAPLTRAESAPYSTTAAATIGSVVSGDPLLEGVLSLTVGWRPLQNVDPDAELVASWSDGVPLAAVKGPVVSLGWRLSTSDPSPTGDWQRLLTNAIMVAVGNIEL